MSLLSILNLSSVCFRANSPRGCVYISLGSLRLTRCIFEECEVSKVSHAYNLFILLIKHEANPDMKKQEGHVVLQIWIGVVYTPFIYVNI